MPAMIADRTPVQFSALQALFVMIHSPHNQTQLSYPLHKDRNPDLRDAAASTFQSHPYPEIAEQ